MSIHTIVDDFVNTVKTHLAHLPQPGAPLVQEQNPDTLFSPSGAFPSAKDEIQSSERSLFLQTGDPSALARMIDHTLLRADALPEEIDLLCQEALKYHFATVCIHSSYVPRAAQILKGSQTIPIAVVGFPLGASLTLAKAFEAKEAIRAGAQEIDMVVNLGALKSGDYLTTLDDIRAVVEVSYPYPVKVIIETCTLNASQKIIACALAKSAGAAFVKTSTGFGSGGATVEDIALMRKTVGPAMGVKASGGIRTWADAQKMIAAGASRLGTSAGIAILSSAQDLSAQISKDSQKPPSQPSTPPSY